MIHLRSIGLAGVIAGVVWTGVLAAGPDPARAAEDKVDTRPIQVQLEPYGLPDEGKNEAIDVTIFLHTSDVDEQYRICSMRPRIFNDLTFHLYTYRVPRTRAGKVDMARLAARFHRVINRTLGKSSVTRVDMIDGIYEGEEYPIPGTAVDNPRDCVSVKLRAKRLKAN